MVGMVEMVMSNDKVSQRVKRLSKGGSQKNMNHGEKAPSGIVILFLVGMQELNH
jgi:hypothetical protein